MLGQFNIRPTNTYSIIAVDKEYGEIGIAVQSHWFSVGTSVAWIRAGTGAVATQSFINPSFGPIGFTLLEQGYTPEETIQELLKNDDGYQARQVAVINKVGEASAFTGTSCFRHAGHYVGPNYSVQANLMSSEKVWSAMSETFENSKGHLAERLLSCLEAAQAQGGDIRGKQSANLKIARLFATGKEWEDNMIDLRIDDHPEPLKEMKRLLTLFRAYEHMDKGEKAIELNDKKQAEEEYSQALNLCPDNLEIRFWHTISKIDTIQDHSVEKELHSIFERDNRWAIMLERLAETGMVQLDDERLSRLIKNNPAL